MTAIQPTIIYPLNPIQDKIQWQHNQSIHNINANITPYNPQLYTDTPTAAAAAEQHRVTQQRIHTVNNIVQYNNDLNNRVAAYYRQCDLDATQRYNALPTSAKAYLCYLFGYQHGGDSMSDAQLARVKLVSYALPDNVLHSYRNSSGKITDLLSGDELTVYKQAVREAEIAQSRSKAAEWREQQSKLNKHTHTRSKHSQFDTQYSDIVDDAVETPRQPAVQRTQQQIDLKQCCQQLKQHEFVPSVCSCSIDLRTVTDYNNKHLHTMMCQYYDNADAYIQVLQQVIRSLEHAKL